MAAYSTAIGTVGVGLLLLAYFLSLAGVLSQARRPYALLNVVGAALACYASWLIGFIPFVVLEGIWMLVSAVALVRRTAPGR